MGRVQGRSRIVSGQPDNVMSPITRRPLLLAIVLLAFIVHWAGGGALDLRLGHFILNVGVT